MRFGFSVPTTFFENTYYYHGLLASADPLYSYAQYARVFPADDLSRFDVLEMHSDLPLYFCSKILCGRLGNEFTLNWHLMEDVRGLCV